MDKIKRFITCHIPVYSCNFRCSYCYVGQHENAYNDGIRDFCTTPENIALFFSKERTGGICYFNLCGFGETFLHPQLISLVSSLTDSGHYVDIITNGVISNKIDEMINVLTEEQKKHLFIKFSFHYLELRKKQLLEKFHENVQKCVKSKISYTIEITPHDELIPYIEEIKEQSLELFGALPHISVARNEETSNISLLSKYTKEKYKEIWSVFDSTLFDFKLSIFNEKRKEFCYAGEWSLSVNLLTGDYTQCYCGKKLGNIKELSKPINFTPIGACPLPHCFNGHAFLAWGNIPELNTPLYVDERNRYTNSNFEWLQQNCKVFFSSKLNESNRELSTDEKKRIYRRNFFFAVYKDCVFKIKVFIKKLWKEVR